MKIKSLFLLFFLLFIISVKAQIYTPSGTIQGTSSNDNIGIGTNSPVTKLDVIGNARISTTLTVGLGTVVGNRFITFSPTTDTSMPNIQGILAGTGPGSFTLQGLGGNVGIGSQNPPVAKLDIIGAKTTTYTSSLSSPTNDFLRVANIHGSGGADQYSALSLMVTGNNGSNNAYVNLAVIQPAAANSNSEFALTVRKSSGIMNEVLRAKSDGKIGIGTSNPVGALHVVDAAGGFFFDGSSTGYNRMKSTAVAPGTPKPLLISAQLSGTTPDIYIDTAGNVGLGSMNPTSKLTVAGNINSREVKVTVDAGADFVFENNYNLPSLDVVEKYIKENKHLPEIASADEMKQEGINLSEMNIKLLQKIEELTLYTIEQQKNTEKLTKIIETLTKRLEVVEGNNLKQ